MPTEMTGSQVPEMFGLCHERERIEAELGKNIYNILNHGEALGKLQKVGGVILRRMSEDPSVGSEIRAFNAAVQDEGDLRLWDKIGPTKSAFKLFGSSPAFLQRLDVTDVADIIRLAGTWVEKGGGQAREDFAAKKEVLRGGVGAGPKKVWGQPGKEEGKRLAAEKAAGMSQEVRGARWRDEGWMLEPQLREFTRDPQGYTGMGGVRTKKATAAGSKRLVSGSNLSIINRLFGLSWGCDISGTTCDEVFALDTWGPEILGHRGYAVLPLGAIVHNTHHTVLEVALPLTINDRIDYRVGFFETLIPRQGLPPELEPIRNVIANADQRMQGKHLLRYYRNGRPVGCFRFTDDEIAQLKRADISHARSLLQLTSTGRISVFPSRDEVGTLIQKYFN